MPLIYNTHLVLLSNIHLPQKSKTHRSHPKSHMAENLKKNLDIHRRQQKQPTRLQKRAPASIQINPVTDWNVAIPLLSPLVQSPTSNSFPAEIKTGSNSNNKDPAATAEKPVVVMKKWQHPAAPFCYEPAPLLPFVCTGSFGR